MIQDTLPASNEALRQALYAGQIFRIKANDASRRLIARVIELLSEEFGTGTPLVELQHTIDGAELYARIGKVRKLLVDEHQIVFDVVTSLGFPRADNAVDPARLRAVTDRGHENPLAAPAYTAHRDTWYGSPESQINFWIPLFDVNDGQTFAFFRSRFDKAVPNESEGFDYDQFASEVGWQSTNGKARVYPTTDTSGYEAEGECFALDAGDILLFSASHLHQTTKNVSGVTRFSVDFRIVNLDDHAKGLGAPNVDNRSTGSALKDFLQPQQA